MTIPTDNETATDVFYRIHLRVRDSVGNVTETTRDLLPRTSTAKLATLPSGWPLTLDGQPVTTPLTFPGVVGVQRVLGAPPQTVNGRNWVMDSWEGGSTATERAVPMATGTVTYTALYRVDGGSVGTGTGLSGTYFATNAFTSPVLTRVDRSPFITWTGAPAPGVPANGFSVRWTGQLQGQFTGTHTLYLKGDDRARVWLGGTKILDTFAAPTTAEVTATVALTAGQRYPLVIELADDSGTAKLSLKWSRATMLPKSVIPGTQLYP